MPDKQESSPPLQVSKISPAEFQAIRSRWNELLAVSSADNLFLTWEWLSLWLEVFHEGREPLILSCSLNGEWVGLAPLIVRKVDYFNLLTFRRIEFMASGEDEKDEICSEYLNFIMKRGLEREVAGAFLSYLDKSGEWDEVVLENMVFEDPSTESLISCLRNSSRAWEQIDDDSALHIKLPRSWDDMLASLSSKRRQVVRRGILELAALEGGEIWKVSRADEIPGAFGAMVALHQERWNARGKPGCFSSGKFTRFHEKAIPMLLASGNLEWTFIKAEGKPRSVAYDFVYHDKVYLYLTGIHADWRPKLGIGNIHLSRRVLDSINAGHSEIDFLKGGEKPSALSWSNGLRRIIRIRISRKGLLKERLLSLFNGLKRLARPVKKLAVRSREAKAL